MRVTISSLGAERHADGGASHFLGAASADSKETSPPSPICDELDLSELSTLGFNADGIEQGRAKITVALNAGIYPFPGRFDNTQVRFSEGCTATIQLILVKTFDGTLRIKGFDLALSKDAVIENPASAFLKKKTGFFARATSAVADHLAKVHLRGIRIDQFGTIHLDGELRKGGLFNTPLNELEGISIPTINTDVVAYSGTFADAKNDFVFYELIIKTLGLLAGECSYDLDLDAKKSLMAHMEGKLRLSDVFDFSTSGEESVLVERLLAKASPFFKHARDRPLFGGEASGIL